MASRSTLPQIDLLQGQPFAAALLRFQRLGYALARTISERNLTDVFVRQAQPMRDGGAEAPHRVRSKNLNTFWRRIHGENQPQKGRYALPFMPSRTKTRLRVSADLRPEIAQALKAARGALGYKQTDLAALLGCSQGTITRWERAIDSPPISAITILSRIVPEEQRAFWLEAGAIQDSAPAELKDTREVSLLRDPAACGTPRALDEREIEDVISFPRKWLPRGGSICAIRVTGDSMSPILQEGYIALIDTSRRDVKSLENCMVAARDGDGVTLKWLRKQGQMYLLVPEYTSQRHPVMVWTNSDDKAIVGEVVKWIGEPHATRKRK
jgi:SOS-response transcriptional repressor LexA